MKSPARCPIRVVALLEVVDVEHHQRERPIIAAGPAQLALEGLEEVALVEDLGQPVDRRQAIDLLVIQALDVVAAQELEDGAPDLDQVAVL
jgi:hypothetical protein